MSATIHTDLDLLPVFLYVVAMMCISLLGNGVTCFIYGYRLRQTVTRNFIFTLSMLDLLASLIGMPLEIYIVAEISTFKYSELCKFSRYITYVCHSSTSLVLLAIASDRYFKVCRPLRPFFNVRKSRIFCLSAIIVSLVLAAPSIALYGTKSLPSINGTTCSIADDMVNTQYPLIYFALFASCFVLVAVSMAALYIKVIRQMRALKNAQIMRRSHETIRQKLENDRNSRDINNGGGSSVAINDLGKKHRQDCPMVTDANTATPRPQEDLTPPPPVSEDSGNNTDESPSSSDHGPPCPPLQPPPHPHTNSFEKLSSGSGSDEVQSEESTSDSANNGSEQDSQSYPETFRSNPSATPLTTHTPTLTDTCGGGPEWNNAVAATHVKASVNLHGTIFDGRLPAKLSSRLSPERSSAPNARQSKKVKHSHKLKRHHSSAVRILVNDVEPGPRGQNHQPICAINPLMMIQDDLSSAQIGSETSGQGSLTDSEDERNAEDESARFSFRLKEKNRKMATLSVPQSTVPIPSRGITRSVSRFKSVYKPGKTTRMLLTITILFFTSFLPFFTIVILRTKLGVEYFFSLDHAQFATFGIFIRSYLVSNAANPIIYGFLNDNFRKQVKKIFYGKFQRWSRRNFSMTTRN